MEKDFNIDDIDPIDLTFNFKSFYKDIYINALEQAIRYRFADVLYVDYKKDEDNKYILTFKSYETTEQQILDYIEELKSYARGE
jgi:hypothetical protein